MRILIVVLFLAALFFPSIIFAYTEREYQDVVYLKNGSIVHGIIIEQITDVSVKIKTETGDLWVFSYDEIEKITKEQIGSVVKAEIDRKGFLGSSKTGYVSQIGGGGGGIFSFGAVNGIGLGPVFIGGGIEYGFGSGWWWLERISFLPIYGETKVFFMPKSHFSPTAYIDAGVQTAWISTSYDGSSTETGLLVGAGGGVEYRVSPHLGFDFNFGYRGSKLGNCWLNHIGFTGGITY